MSTVCKDCKYMSRDENGVLTCWLRDVHVTADTTCKDYLSRSDDLPADRPAESQASNREKKLYEAICPIKQKCFAQASCKNCIFLNRRYAGDKFIESTCSIGGIITDDGYAITKELCKK